MKSFFFTSSSFKTKKLGEFLAKKIFKTKPGKKDSGRRIRTRFCGGAFIIGLEGDLGGGKTTFLQGFAKGLGIKEKILSPTFVIIKRFQLNNLTPKKNQRFLTGQAIKQFNNFYHVDCYRIKKPKELLSLGFKEIISNPKNIVAIEWADNVREIVPKQVIWIKFEFINKKKRRIIIKNLKN